MKETNKDRILSEAVHLFNLAGAATTSTNHICERLRISPGNLYFHFKNKEEISRALFSRMCNETYFFWKTTLDGASPVPPLEFVEHSLKIFWRYRFFHREMYHLRRQDPALNQMWHSHLSKSRKFMRAAYARWVKKNYMKPMQDSQTMRIVGDIVLVTASSFFQFYETVDKPATEKPLKMANKYLAHFLLPHFSSEYVKTVKIDPSRMDH